MSREIEWFRVIVQAGHYEEGYGENSVLYPDFERVGELTITSDLNNAVFEELKRLFTDCLAHVNFQIAITQKPNRGLK